ncbi:MAG: geranylgeranyl reductase family protein [Candidatus Methylarchaceae archaeon HK01B]|nr:geranylgeranyl reductase family protein [Candidatus Methylarchaceae archaeon HK01B]
MEVVDVIVAGGGICGLIAAREIAASGLRVTVLEEDLEIGIPEKCGGLISLKALTSLGLFPSRKIVKNEIKGAVIYSPLGSKLEVKATKQRVIVLDRREFDRELARIAKRSGALIEVGQRVSSIKAEDELVKVETERYARSAKIFVDARGISSLKHGRQSGFLQAAQYDVYGSWFEKDRVELYLDNRVAPGFFTWVIPLDDDIARLGVAGKGMNPKKFLDGFVKDHKATAIKKIVSPIYVGGASENFIHGNIVVVGDAAGQTKPTTGGGIFTGGVGGLLAGRAVLNSLLLNDPSALREYEVEWRRIFRKEFMVMSQARKIYEKLENERIERLFKTIASSNILERLEDKADFDYHSIGIFQILAMMKEDPSLALELMKLGAGVIFEIFKGSLKIPKE